MPADALIRFVVAPDGTVVPDLRRRLPGRGVWVTATAAKVAEAEKQPPARPRLRRRRDGRARPCRPRRPPASPTPRSPRCRSPARPGTSSPVSPRSRRRWPSGRAIGLLHAADAGADGVAKLAAAAALAPAAGTVSPRLSAVLRGKNWIWHSGAKCDTCCAARRAGGRQCSGAGWGTGPLSRR